MATFLAATILFLVLFAAMSIGVIFSNKPIKGSCGGLNNVGLGGTCEICGGDLDKCEENGSEKKEAVDPTDLSYEAARKS